MPGIVSAWLVGEGIIFWRSWKQNKAFPVPGQLIAASFIFVLLALLAENDKARPLAVTMAWGFNIAALLNVLPQVAVGGTAPAGEGSIGNALQLFTTGHAAQTSATAPGSENRVTP